MEIPQLHQLFLQSQGISTDTRKIRAKSMFFALKGANFNANEFAQEALKKGASYAIVDEKEYAVSKNIILVDDTLKTLQHLAQFHREYLDIPIIGLTGSNGKTTTKELINAVLSSKFKTSSTKGNLNNHIGVPLTLLQMTKTTEIGIVEMGANHHGEIRDLCKICKPNYGYITNFGKAHLEGFGSLEGVKKAKSELYDYLKDHGGLIFINADDETQQKQIEYPRNFTFGTQKSVDILYKLIKTDPFVSLKFQNRIINSQLLGSYNAPNIAAAIAIGKFFKIKDEEIAAAIENYIPKNNRSQIIKQNNNTIILDAYNANPTSMEAALKSFEELPSSQKIIVLGDMFEVGSSSAEEHQNIVEILNGMIFKQAFLVGEHFNKTKTSKDNIQKFKTINELNEVFKIKNLSETTILIKGSRGMALERLLEM